jgi:CO/xanthine dehydrogenase Mo-binding subunit
VTTITRPPEAPSEELVQSEGLVGVSVPRLDAWDKVTGATVYTGDLQMPNMLHGKILWSAHPHARIRGIDTSAARAMPGVHAVLTAADVPGTNRFGLAILDQRVLADDKVRNIADPVALVAAETEEQAEEALEKIVVDYEVLPAILSIEDALAPGAATVHDEFVEQGNVLRHTTLRKGDVEAGFRQADLIVERTYRTHSMDHAAMEPEAGLAYMDPTGVLTVLTPTQYPFRDRRQIAPNLGLPMNRVRVMQMPIGGGFGRKDDITAEIHVGLLALKTGRPVRLVYTREESLFANTKRHPMVIRYKSGATRQGRLTAVEAEIYGDTGPFASLGMYVVKKAGIHATGPYFVPNVKADTHTVYTNNLTAGAMRGFGVLQVAVAHESQMDILARELGISPLEFRLINCLKVGQSTATGQIMRAGTGIEATLLRIKEYMEQHGITWTTPPGPTPTTNGRGVANA